MSIYNKEAIRLWVQTPFSMILFVLEIEIKPNIQIKMIFVSKIFHQICKFAKLSSLQLFAHSKGLKRCSIT